MATATVGALYIVADLCDSGSAPILNGGHANNAAQETVLQIQGSACYACGYTGTPPGTITPVESEFSIFAEDVAMTNWDGANSHVGVWMRVLYPVHSKADGGLIILVWCSGTNQRRYFAVAGSPEYSGEWIFAVVDTNETVSGIPDQTSFMSNGSPVMTGAGAIVGVGVGYACIDSKGEDFLQNQYFDHVIRTDGSGNFGLRFSGGLTGDRLFLSDLALGGSSPSGIFQGSGILYTASGQVILGGAALTTWVQDSGKTVIFADMPVATDFYKVSGETGTLTNVDLQGVTWLGLAAAPFDFDFSALTTGDAADFSGDVFSDGNLIKWGPEVVADNTTYNRVANIQPFGMTLDSPVFNNSELVTLDAVNDLISGGSTNLHNTLTSVGFVSTDDLDKITAHNFDNTGGVGWAIDLGVIAATRSDNCDSIFTGYSTTVNGNKAIHVSVASGQTYTINVTGGNLAANLVYNSGLGTLIVQNAVTVEVTVLDDTTGSPLLDARVQLYLTSDHTTVVLNAATDVLGVATTSWAYAGDADVTGWARQFDVLGTDYVQKDIGGTITTNGLFLTVRLEPVT